MASKRFELPEEYCPQCGSGHWLFVREVYGPFQYLKTGEIEQMPTSLLKCKECGTEFMDRTVWTPEGYMLVEDHERPTT